MKTLKEIYQANEELNYIDSSLYSRYRVKAGLRNDNGTGVKVGLTKICDVIGYKFVHEKKYNIDGQLIYREYPINYLVDKQPKDRIFGFEEVAFLLIFGTLPTEEQLQEFKDYLLNFKMGPVDLQAENILCMARGNDQYTLEEARILDTLLMIHADHGGGNNSTFANVVISSTGTDIYSCISAAIGSLKGPKHGGANCKVTNMFKAIFHEVGFTTDKLTLKKIANRLLDKDFFDHSGLIYGIGHAIYTKSDPRALLIQQQCEMLAKSKGQEDIYNCIHAFEKVAVEVMKERKGIDVCANVDYYSGYVYSLLGIENDLFTPLFAISRTAGWVSHHLENRQSNRKLIRPANVYVGGMEENE